MTHTFVGTTSTTVDLDANEYVGMTVPQITADILKTLRDIAPEVDYWNPEIEMAAIQIRRELNKKFDVSDL